jgi:molybdate transport system substrate-binding protein
MITSPRRLAHLAVLLATLMGLSVSACGSDSTANSTTSAAAQSREVIVFGRQLAEEGLDELRRPVPRRRRAVVVCRLGRARRQIRQGIKPDVFAAANIKLPDQLFKQGLVEKPVSFATNELVLAVPADSHKVSSLEDLTGNA